MGLSASCLIAALALSQAPVSAKLAPGQTRHVVPTAADAVIKQTPVVVRLPRTTPYGSDAKKEQVFLEAYCKGFLDSVNFRLV